jgi:Xaa-Pro aminopeptidase
MTVEAHSAFSAAPNVQLIPAQQLLDTLRTVKDMEEKRRIQAAQAIAERAFDEILGILSPEMTEQEAAAELVARMLRHDAERMSFDPIVVAGPNSSRPHGEPSAAKIGRGRFLTMDFGCISGGYCSDMTRTVAFGPVSDEMRNVYDTVLRAQEAGIRAVRAGGTGKAGAAAARAVIAAARYGSYFGHSFGHGIGIEIHERPNAAPSSDQPLPAGAVISAEPGIYLPGRFGVRIEDMLFVTESGCENLTHAPKELIVLK